MKVSALIRFLSTQDPDADVIITHQPNYPLELTLQYAVQRADLLDEDEELKERDGKPEDVILAAGDWLRYGTKRAWQM